MTTLPWYAGLLYVWWRIQAWLPVVHRYGTWYDLNDRLHHALGCTDLALESLESYGEDGYNRARAYLYAALDSR